MFIHYTNFQIDCIKLYIHCCPFSHRRTLVFNGSIWFLVFFSMHSCHSVSGSMCNECMLVGSLVGWTDGWMVAGYTFQCSECCIVYMESVCSSGQYIYTYILYSRKCIRNFCIHIEIYDNTLSSWARPSEEHHHHHRHHWFTTFAVLWIVLVSLLKTNWNELVGWLVLLNRCGCG